eukprot:1494390-Rhodomonas_salina.3
MMNRMNLTPHRQASLSLSSATAMATPYNTPRQQTEIEGTARAPTHLTIRATQQNGADDRKEEDASSFQSPFRRSRLKKKHRWAQQDRVSG